MKEVFVLEGELHGERKKLVVMTMRLSLGDFSWE